MNNSLCVGYAPTKLYLCYMVDFWLTLSDQPSKYGTFGEDRLSEIVQETLNMMTVTKNRNSPETSLLNQSFRIKLDISNKHTVLCMQSISSHGDFIISIYDWLWYELLETLYFHFHNDIYSYYTYCVVL